MSVTTYEIGCKYLHQKLKNKVYFLSKSFFNPSTNSVTVHIDNGGASVSIVTHVPHPTPPNVIEGFGIKFTETESLDERYKFTKQLNISINGHLTDTTWLLENDYYIMVETIEGIFYLINVDFPSKMNFTYNLSNSQDQTDFVFTSNSNFPTLKVNSVPWESFNACKTYHVPGIDYLKLLEKGYATIDKENGVVNLFNSQTFKNIDYLKNTISLQETYDGDIATTTISFEIPFDDYKTSWQYNLLEFKQNLYVAEVGNANDNAIFAGFEHGLEPQYEINGSTSESESTSIKITLTEASNWGIFEYDSWSYNNVSEKKWIGVDSEVKCIGLGVGINTLMVEVDENNTPTGRYKCLEGYENEYTDYNIIGTYAESDVERFRTSVCTKFKTRGGVETGYYTCINGDKYEYLGNQVTYDGGKNWINTEGMQLGPIVERDSSYCEIEPDYKWELTNKWVCESGSDIKYTYITDDEYVVETYDDSEVNDFRYRVYNSNNELVAEQACNGKPILETGDFPASVKDGYNKWATAKRYKLVVGECIDTIDLRDWGYSVLFFDELVLPKYSLTKIIHLYGFIGLGRNLFIPNTVKYFSPGTTSDVSNNPGAIPSNYFTITGFTFETGSTVETLGRTSNNTTLNPYTIPKSVKNIDYYAIPSATRRVVFESDSELTELPDHCFSACTALTTVVLPERLKEISDSCFYGCTSLTNLNFINGIEKIQNSGFRYCSGLKNIEIPSSVIEINRNAFEYCNPDTIVFNDGLKMIGDCAFNFTFNTPSSFSFTGCTLPDSLEYLGDESFCIAWYSNYSNHYRTLTFNTPLKLKYGLEWYKKGMMLTGNTPNNLEETNVGALTTYWGGSTSAFTVPPKVRKITKASSTAKTPSTSAVITMLPVEPPYIVSGTLPNNFNGTIIVPAGYGNVYKQNKWWSAYENNIVEAT